MSLEKFKKKLEKKIDDAILYLLQNVFDENIRPIVVVFTRFFDSLSAEKQSEVVESLKKATQDMKRDTTREYFFFCDIISDLVFLHISSNFLEIREKLVGKFEAIKFDNELTQVSNEINTWYSYKILGDYFYNLDHKQSINAYKKSLKKKNTYQVNYNIANVYSMSGDQLNGIKHYVEADKLMPDNVMILYNYGFTLKLAAEYKRANEVFKKLEDVFNSQYKSNPENIDWLSWGDHLAYNQGKPQEAIEKYEAGILKLASDDEKQIDLRANLMYCYFKSKSLEKLNSEKRVDLNSKGWRLYDQLMNSETKLRDRQKGEVLVIAEKYENALAVFEELESNSQNCEDVQMFIGMCHDKLENYQEAINSLKKALEIGPSITVQTKLAEAFRKNKDFINAELALREIFERTNREVDALLNWVSLCIDIGNSQINVNEVEALAYFNKALETICELLKIGTSNTYSRKLSIHEISQLNYDLGYIEVQIAKGASSKRSKSHFNRALKSFASVNQSTTFYIKSQTAIDKIKIHLKDEIRHKNSRLDVLFYLGVTLLAFTLFVSIVGKPVIITKLNIDPIILSNRVSQTGYYFVPDSLGSVILNQELGSLDKFKGYFNSVIYPDKCRLDLSGIDDRLTTNRLIFVDHKLGDTVNIFLYTASIACLLIGLMFDQVKSISVGTISIDRSGDNNTSSQFDFKMVRS